MPTPCNDVDYDDHDETIMLVLSTVIFNSILNLIFVSSYIQNDDMTELPNNGN